MLKKVLIALETLIMIGAVAFGIITYMQKVKVIADRDTLLVQNANLQQSVDAIGPTANVYTVKTQMVAGTPVMVDDLQTMTVPVSAIPADAVTNLDQIVYVDPVSGAKDYKYYKVTVSPFTMLTQDLLMNEDYSQPLYERDVYLDWLPIGLKAHDCIDIRISYPDGTDLVVFEHKRVYMVLDKVIKLKMTYGELVRYTSLLTEKSFYEGQNLGVRVYATAYIEPGLTKNTKAKILYPLSEGASVMAARDPNIKDKNEFINLNLRQYLDQKMKVYLTNVTDDFGVYSQTNMISSETSAMDQGASLYEEMYIKLESDESVEQPTDLTGTGWDGEIVNGGRPYKNPDYSAPAEGDGTSADSGLGGGLPTGGTEQVGSLSSTMDNLQGSVNDSYDQLNGLAGDIQSGQYQGTTTPQQGGQTSFPTVDVPATQPAVQETQPAVQETQPAVQETQSAVQETNPPSAETQAAADSSGNTQGITSEDKTSSRQSGNLFNNPGIQ